MPFQSTGSINTALWRSQSTDPVSGVVTENYINLSEVKKMKTLRDSSNPKVWLWFQTDRLDSRDADLILSGAEAAVFLAALDGLYT